MRVRGFALFLAGYVLALLASDHVYGSLAVPAPFWLPDAVLLCALLLTRPSVWWTFLLAIWPIRLALGAVPGTPLWFVATSIANDSVKALAGAWLLQRILGRAPRLVTLRELLIFLGVAGLALPAASALAAAPARVALGDRLWPTVSAWFLGDSLAQVIVAPMLLYWLTGSYLAVRRRLLEMALMTGTLIAVLYYGFVVHEMRSPLFLYIPVPLLLWAALRLGPFGTANGLALLACASILSAARDTSLFPGGAGVGSVLAMQLFLLMIGVSKLSLAVLVTERETRMHDLEALLDERQISERRLQDLSGRLIHVQDEERARVARDLHDDLGQRLALLQISVEQLEQQAPALSAVAGRHWRAIADSTPRIVGEIHDLSRRLHPSSLAVLGLVKSLTGFCQDFAERHDMAIHFLPDDVPPSLTRGASLCVFRIVQEALHNVQKHSGVAEATVELNGQRDSLRLSVSDNGRGFHPESVTAGLGLVSMRERLRPFGGRMAVRSAPYHGVHIRIDLPYAPGEGATERVLEPGSDRREMPGDTGTERGQHAGQRRSG